MHLDTYLPPFGFCQHSYMKQSPFLNMLPSHPLFIVIKGVNCDDKKKRRHYVLNTGDEQGTKVYINYFYNEQP